MKIVPTAPNGTPASLCMCKDGAVSGSQQGAPGQLAGSSRTLRRQRLLLKLRYFVQLVPELGDRHGGRLVKGLKECESPERVWSKKNVTHGIASWCFPRCHLLCHWPEVAST